MASAAAVAAPAKELRKLPLTAESDQGRGPASAAGAAHARVCPLHMRLEPVEKGLTVVCKKAGRKSEGGGGVNKTVHPASAALQQGLIMQPKLEPLQVGRKSGPGVQTLNFEVGRKNGEHMPGQKAPITLLGSAPPPTGSAAWGPAAFPSRGD